MVQIRKKSPRSPSLPLEQAVDKVLRIYEKEGKHPIPVDIAAKDIGYKDAKSGASLTALASLKYFGLLIKPKEGYVAVSKEVEDYKFYPNVEMRRDIVLRWLNAPKVYAELLSKFAERLPSDATLKYELIQLGFSEQVANDCLVHFKKSVEFAGFYSVPTNGVEAENNTKTEFSNNTTELVDPVSRGQEVEENPGAITKGIDSDRFPIRLSGGRRAWLEIPVPFFTKDKELIKSQVELILTDD